MMHELEHKAKKELEKIADQGFTNSNLDVAYKLVDIVKDIKEIEEKDSSGGQYGRYDGYRDYRDDYLGNRSSYMTRDNYRGNERFNRNIDRIKEGADMYWYGRERYNAGGNKEQMNESLENMMYAVCSLIESGMDIAETPEEKEIIRKHIRKLQSL
jgi:hypothetical protein